MITEKRAVFFTILPEMVGNPCPSFLLPFFPEDDRENKTWADIISNNAIKREYGHQGNTWIHTSTETELLVFQIVLPSFIGGELLELITIMADNELPDANLDIVAKITDVTANIPDTILSMYFPQTYSGGVVITWQQLFALSDAWRADNTQPYYNAEYFEHEGNYYVDIPDLLILIWGLFVKKGYGESSPLVAIYSSPDQLKEYLTNE